MQRCVVRDKERAKKEFVEIVLLSRVKLTNGNGTERSGGDHGEGSEDGVLAICQLPHHFAVVEPL